MYAAPGKLVHPRDFGDHGDLVDARRHHHLVKVLHLARIPQRDSPFPILPWRRDLPDGRGESKQVADIEVVGVVFEVLFDGGGMRKGRGVCIAESSATSLGDLVLGYGD